MTIKEMQGLLAEVQRMIGPDAKVKIDGELITSTEVVEGCGPFPPYLDLTGK